MSKTKLPKWFQVHDDGTLIVTWKDGTKPDPFNDIETALRQTIHIMEQYGNQKIYLDKGQKVVIFIGKIGELKQLKELTIKTTGFLKSFSLNSNIGIEIRGQINKSEQEILTSISSEMEKDVKIYFAVMRRSLVIKNEIIREKHVFMNVRDALVDSYESLCEKPTKLNLKRIKNRIAGKGANLINGFENIIANPYKARITLPQIKRLNTISNVSSVEQLKIIIKNAVNRIYPAIEEELKIQEIESKIFLPNSR